MSAKHKRQLKRQRKRLHAKALAAAANELILQGAPMPQAGTSYWWQTVNQMKRAIREAK